jgi:hypothetical protein
MNDRRFRLIGIPVLSLLITLLTLPLHGFPALPRFTVSLGISLYFTTALWLGNRALWAWLLRRLPHVDQTPRRLAALVGLSVAYTVVATLLLRLPLRWLLPAYFKFEGRWAHLLRRSPLPPASQKRLVARAA